jgi:hypothetical protein
MKWLLLPPRPTRRSPDGTPRLHRLLLGDRERPGTSPDGHVVQRADHLTIETTTHLGHFGETAQSDGADADAGDLERRQQGRHASGLPALLR